MACWRHCPRPTVLTNIATETFLYLKFRKQP